MTSTFSWPHWSDAKCVVYSLFHASSNSSTFFASEVWLTKLQQQFFALPTWSVHKNNRMISVRFQGKPFNITVIQVYAQQVTLEKLKLNGSMMTYKPFRTNTQKDVLFIIGDWNAKAGS